MQRGALRRRGYAKLLFYFKKLLSAFSAGAIRLTFRPRNRYNRGRYGDCGSACAASDLQRGKKDEHGI